MIVGAGVFVVGTVGAGAYLGVLGPKDTSEPAILVAQPVETTPAEPKVNDVQTQVVEPETAAVGTAETTSGIANTPSAPTVDEVRNEADGFTVIAGRAEPGSEVTLLVDGVANMTVQVGGDGTFAAVTVLVPNGDAQVLTIVQQIDGSQVAAADIILAPRAVAVARAEPEVGVQTSVAVADPAGPEPTAEAATETEVAAVRPDPKPATPEAEPEAKPQPEPVAEQVAILKADESGVEIINRSSAPEVMSNVAIDTISYSQGGDVLLSGRAQSQASAVRVYLNNAVVTTLEVDTSGRWRGDLPDVDTGIYTLRVDEVDEGGDVTSRVETPFKREAPAALAAAQNDTDKPVKAITVQTGATLWAIARERYGDGTLYVRVLDANKGDIRNPDLIYPGQVFELPE